MTDFSPPTGKSVLLFSGGMDSVCHAWLLRPDRLLTLRVHSDYEQRERRAMRKALATFAKAGDYRPEHIVLDRVLNLGDYRKGPFIYPMRNAFLIEFAAYYGETIYLAGVEGDSPADKTPQFLTKMQDLLTEMWQGNWTTPHYFTVTAPYRHTTKTELIGQYLGKGGPPQALWSSYSCYSGDDLQCGTCRNCVRKWVAFENNALRWERGLSQHPPWEAQWVWDLWEDLLVGKYHGDREDKLILRAFDQWWRRFHYPGHDRELTAANDGFPDLASTFWGGQ